MSKYTRTVMIGGNEWVVDRNDMPIRRVATHYGNSTRTRPMYEDGARDADRLMEEDTGKVFVFDEDIMDWRKM